jgi:hypothetical protein
MNTNLVYDECGNRINTESVYKICCHLTCFHKILKVPIYVTVILSVGLVCMKHNLRESEMQYWKAKGSSAHLILIRMK